MTYGQTPLDGSQTPIPLGTAVTPGDRNPHVIEGGPAITDGQGNTLVPVAEYTYDGGNVTFGSEADAAASSDSATASYISLFKRFLAKVPVIGPQLKAASTSVTIATDQGAISVTDTNSAAEKTDLDSIVANEATAANQATANTSLASIKTDNDTEVTDLNALAGAVSGGKVLTTETNSAASKTDLDAINTATSGAKTDLDSLVTNGATAANQATANTTLSGIKTDNDTEVTDLNALNTAFGSQSAAASTDYTTNNPFMTFVKGSIKILADVWDSVNHRLYVSQGASQILLGTLQNAYTGTPATPYAGTNFNVAGMATCDLTVTGTGLWTLTFRGYSDASQTWTNLLAEQLGTQNAMSTATSGPGTFRVSCDGLQVVQAQVTQFTSGSVTVTAMAVPVAGRSHNVNANITNWGNIAPGLNNPVITEDQIRGWIANGQGFSATTGLLKSGAATLTLGMGVYNPSSAKTILIYSIRAYCASTAPTVQLANTTADPAFGSAGTAVNLKTAGGSSSVATVDQSANNASSGVSTIGSPFDFTGLQAGVEQELLTNGACVVLPSGNNGGLGVYISVATSNSPYVITIRWVEI